MTDELRQKLERLRALAPGLNAVTEQAGRIVQEVDRFLGEEVALGISAASPDFAERPAEDEELAGLDPDCERRVRSCLAYGRVAGRYRLHVLHQVEQREGVNWRADWYPVMGFDVEWSKCSREVKLSSIEMLPELLDRIVDRALELSGRADKAAATVRELIGSGGRPGGEMDLSRAPIYRQSLEESRRNRGE